MGAVAVHEGQVSDLSKELDKIQRRYFPGIKIPIALHATDIYQAKGPFHDLKPDQRQTLMLDVYRLIGEQHFPNFVAFATVLHISALPKEDIALDMVFADMSDRFNLFLKRHYRRGHPTKGLLIIDQTHTQQYRELLRKYHSDGTRYGNLENIVDIPYFASINDTRLLQLADFLAYSVFRYYERNDRKYFDIVLPRFDRRGPNEPPDGLKHITKSVPCSCVACEWRNRQSY
jgi:hypothetical protein